MTTAALEGLKVLDLAWVVAGPTIGRNLADYGAIVVRIESSRRVDTARLMGPFPGGTMDRERSALYDNCNAGKLGICLDLQQGAARDVVWDLVQWADVLIESFAPGQLARWGLAPEALRVLNPRLIGLSTSLMGQTGPFSSLAGFGNVGAAVAGYQAIVGREGAIPIGPFGPYTDFVGPRFALVALFAALEHRRQSDEGCWLDVSQAEAGIQLLAAEIAQTAETGQPAIARGNRDVGHSPSGVFRSSGDDEWVAVAARNDDEWARLAAIIGGAANGAEFATLAGRQANEDRLESIIEGWTHQRSALETEDLLQASGIPAHRVNDASAMAVDPQLLSRGQYVRLERPAEGESIFDASRYALSATPARYARPAPSFGRDREQILIDILNYDDEKIAALEAAGVFV